MNKLGNIDILDASCNISTVQDGRGAIFTWLPSEPIVEFNMLYFHPNKIITQRAIILRNKYPLALRI